MPDDRRVVQVESLYREVRSVLEQARASAYRAVNFAMVRTYWQIGRLIVEHEQSGRKRAAYGEAVLQALSRRLTSEFGRGFDARNLRYMRQCFLVFPIGHALRSESGVPAKRNALRSKSGPPDAAPGLRPELSWTHYRLLLGVEDPRAREWYLREAAGQRWSTRQLERERRLLEMRRPVAGEHGEKL